MDCRFHWFIPTLNSDMLHGARVDRSVQRVPRSIRSTGSTQYFSGNTPWRSVVSHGLVAGVGAEASIGGLRIAPEIRYTRWNKDVINEFGSQGYFVSSGMNQVQVLVGVSWRTSRL